jgi:alkylation response protein AidB-like acyl-CoA dehydrogenase
VLHGWYKRMAAKGWIAPAWPCEYGGMGLLPAKLLIFLEEQERCGITRYQDHGVLMVGPVLMRHGTEAQRRRYLPKILACEEIWCQGYSEPNAGSDLASLRTRAHLESNADGDQFVVNGQKIWTSFAHDATHMFALVRTDPEAQNQKGISFLLLDMQAKGITVRPIRDIGGHEEFCEVFLEDVRTAAGNLVGQLHHGWTVAKSLLGFERIHIGSPKQCEHGLQTLSAIARARGLLDDPVFRDKLLAVRLDVVHLAAIYARFAAVVARGEPLGQDVSLLKIWATETYQRIADLVVEVAGPHGAISGSAAIGGISVDVLSCFYKARPASIYAGSNEIQRNILAKHVLELPAK